MQHIGDLSEILETIEPTNVASGFIFTEGPLWHPDDFWYFVDIRQNKLLRLIIGHDPDLIRETNGGNGNTFDLDGRLINCEGLARRVTRTNQDGSVETIASPSGVGVWLGQTTRSAIQTAIFISPTLISA